MINAYLLCYYFSFNNWLCFGPSDNDKIPHMLTDLCTDFCWIIVLSINEWFGKYIYLWNQGSLFGICLKWSLFSAKVNLPLQPPYIYIHTSTASHQHVYFTAQCPDSLYTGQMSFLTMWRIQTNQILQFHTHIPHTVNITSYFLPPKVQVLHYLPEI